MYAPEEVIADLQSAGYTGITGIVQDWGHAAVERMSSCSGATLELGIGEGRHYSFAATRHQDNGPYVGIDISLTLLQRAQRAGSGLHVAAADSRRLPFRDRTFDRVIAIYHLEHIRELDVLLDEVARVLRAGGEFLVALPTEGGIAWDVGRRLTTKRWAERRFPGLDYLSLVKSEHVQTCRSVLEIVSRRMKVTRIVYLPFRLPTIHLNAVVAFRCVA